MTQERPYDFFPHSARGARVAKCLRCDSVRSGWGDGELVNGYLLHACVNPPLTNCPFCSGSGVVPTASGMSDQECLCVGLNGRRRLIAEGRIDYAERSWWLPEVVAANREQARHVIYGCGYGRCTGNAGNGPCIYPAAS